MGLFCDSCDRKINEGKRPDKHCKACLALMHGAEKRLLEDENGDVVEDNEPEGNA